MVVWIDIIVPLGSLIGLFNAKPLSNVTPIATPLVLLVPLLKNHWYLGNLALHNVSLDFVK